jgi:hypothetical protein
MVTHSRSLIPCSALLLALSSSACSGATPDESTGPDTGPTTLTSTGNSSKGGGAPDSSPGQARPDASADGGVITTTSGSSAGSDAGSSSRSDAGSDAMGSNFGDAEPPTMGGGTNLVMYSNGVIDQAKWPSSNDYTFGGTDDYKDTTHPQAGHQYDLSLTGTYAGWQQASNWLLPYQGGANGVDLSPYTQLQFDVYLSSDDDLTNILAHYTRSTGDDVATCTYVSNASGLAGSLSAGTWHTAVRIPLAYLGMLSSYNTYKFLMQQNTGPSYFDNVQFVAGNTGWIYAGSSNLESGWTDASTTLTADYAWVPQSLSPGGTFDPNSNAGLFAINSPPPAAELSGSLSGTTLTVNNVTAGQVLVGQYLFGNQVAAGTRIVNGSGSTWTVSAASGTVHAESMSAAFTQAQVDGVSLSGSGEWRVTHSGGFSTSAYDHFTFGALPTASGYKYTVQFYDAAGTAIGSAVEAAGSTYTPNDFGVQKADFTVYSIPLGAFGSIGSTIGGVSISVNQKTYLSAIGFWQ